jgi:lipopolysaccharide export system permease protein
VQQFRDSFKGFTFIVEKKIKNNIENVFIHDSSNTLKNLTSDQAEKTTTTIVAKNGVVEEKNMILFDGQVISSRQNKNEIVKFKQLNINLKDLQTGTIKQPKLQETSTFKLLDCMNNSIKINKLNCKKNTKKEITTVLNRRIVLPFYIPIISLLCCFLLVKPSVQNNYFLNKYSIFILSFLVLLYAELVIRYTGISSIVSTLFTISPMIFIPIIYIILSFKLSKESIHNE